MGIVGDCKVQYKKVENYHQFVFTRNLTLEIPEVTFWNLIFFSFISVSDFFPNIFKSL